MSCCVVKKEPTGPIKEVESLRKYFDEVLLEKKEKFQLLTLRDVSPNSNYDWVVYLEVKIPYMDHNSHSGNSDTKYTQGVAKKVLDFIELLKPSKKPTSTLSLFGEEEEEPLPKSPTGGDDNNWSKYYRENERVLRNRLMKKYSFFELCNLSDSWFVYRDEYVVDSWKSKLPQTTKEFFEIVKNEIRKSETQESMWNDEYNYLCRDGALSDIELSDRLRLLIRLEFVEYTDRFHVMVDDSFSSWEIEEQKRYRFSFSTGSYSGNSWLKAADLPEYDFSDKDFLLWVREYFNISTAEVISDDDILRENLKGLFFRIYGSENPTFDALKEIESAKSFKDFKSKANAHAHASNFNGGGTGYSLDGFKASYDLLNSKNSPAITIKQKLSQRLELGRETDGLVAYDEDYVEVYRLNFFQALEEAYRLFNKKEQARQIDLFSFAA